MFLTGVGATRAQRSIILGAVLSLASCSSGTATTGSSASAPAAVPTPTIVATATASAVASVTPSPAPDPALRCKTDADCPRLPCGPCRPNAPVTKGNSTQECFVNPCLDPASVCNVDHFCAVGPNVRPNPKVMGSAVPSASASTASASSSPKHVCAVEL